MRTLHFCWAAAVLASGAAASFAAAQDRPSAAVLETEASGFDAETTGAVDRMIRARLDGLEVVRTSSGVALDLSEVQLALGCVGETPDCLAPVASELSVQLLLIPHLDETGGQLQLTIALYDDRDRTIRRVLRQASGERARTDLLDAVDGQLRELFGLPPAVEPPPGGGGGGGGGSGAPTGPSLSAGPFVVMGIGVAALAVGIGLGVAALDAESEYAGLPDPQTAQQAEDAAAAFSRWEAYAIGADVLLVAGGVAAAGGLAWLLVELLATPSPSAALSPVLGPGIAGLSVSGTWGAP